MQKKEDKFQTKFVHLQGRSQFVQNPLKNEIITVGNDSLLKKVDIATRDEKQTVDLDEEYYAITINPVTSDIAIGGNQNMIKIYNSQEFTAEANTFQFDSKILKLCYSHNGAYIGVLIEKNKLTIINLQTNKMFYGSTESYPVNFNFSLKDTEISEIGQDGKLRIYGLDNISRVDGQNELQLLFKEQIKKEMEGEIQQFESGELLEISWGNENILGIPGATVFQYLEWKREEQQQIQQENQILHQQQIIFIKWLPENSLLTFSKDFTLKIWNFEAKEKLCEIQIVNSVWNIDYHNESNQLIYLDESGYLGFWVLNDLKQKKKKLAIAEEEEDDMKKVILDEMVKKVDGEKNDKAQKDPEVEEISIPMEIEEKKQQKITNKIDQLIDFQPQDILYSSSTQMFKSRRFLKWNLTGSIISRKENQMQYIDIEFADKQFHRNIIIINNNLLSIADMNQSGAILASRGKELNEDEYEDENEKDETKFSHILFKPFNFIHEKEEWNYQLPENERAECVCIGTNWCAVSTDLHMIRVFNLAGFDLNCFSFEKPLVCMAGYENQLAYVCHDGVPILGCQSFKLHILDITQQKIKIQTGLPVSPYSLLTWLGFSEEGLLLAQDSTGMIRGLFEEGWVALFDDSKEKSKFWLIGMINYNFIGINLGKDEFEPSVMPRPFNTQQTIRLPYLNTNEKYKEISVEQLILKHEKQRFLKWKNLKGSRDKQSAGYRNIESILSEAELVNEEEKIEKKIVNLFRELILNNELEKALILVDSMIKSQKAVIVCIKLCEKLQLNFMVKQLNQILQVQIQYVKIIFKQKMQREEHQIQPIQTQKTVYSEIPSQISQFESNKQPPKKFGLSTYAVNKTQALTTEDVVKEVKEVKKSQKMNEKTEEEKQAELSFAENEEILEEKDNDAQNKNPFAMKQLKTTPIKQQNIFDTLGANAVKPESNQKKRLSNIIDGQKFNQFKKELS